MLLRLSKISLVAAAALFLAIVVFNNVTDYGSNFEFVRHVLNMSTTVPGNHGMWRAIEAPAMHHAFYAGIIFWELASTVLIAAGALKLWAAREASAADWQRAKSIATAGLVLNLLLWFLAFITIGGEWFLMWQSAKWNGQNAAFRMFACLGLILIFLQQRDDEPAA